MKLEFSIYRYNPDVDDAPHMQDYTLEAEEGRDMMLLDALIQLRQHPGYSDKLKTRVSFSCLRISKYESSAGMPDAVSVPY